MVAPLAGGVGQNGAEDAITFRPLKEDWCCRMCGIAHLSERYLPQAVREFYQFLVASFPA